MSLRPRLILIAVLALVLSACFSTFDLTDGSFKPRGKTLAVVAGLDNDRNVAAAQYMTDALRKNSRFQVMSQKQVAQSLPGYPQKIKGPYKSAYFEIETDYTKTDVKKIKDIQQRLGVDYLYVIWVPSETTYNEKINITNVVGQMFESPGAKEVGNGKFGAAAGRTTCCLAPTPGDEDKANAMKDSTEYVAKQIAEKTGMKK